MDSAITSKTDLLEIRNKLKSEGKKVVFTNGVFDILHKGHVDYLKESAFLLHEIIDYTNMLINIKNAEWESPLKFDQLYIKGEKRQKIIKNFSNLTGYGAILKIQDNAQRIIDDFRLRAFRKETPTPSSYRLV